MSFMEFVHFIQVVKLVAIKLFIIFLYLGIICNDVLSLIFYIGNRFFSSISLARGLSTLLILFMKQLFVSFIFSILSIFYLIDSCSLFSSSDYFDSLITLL